MSGKFMSVKRIIIPTITLVIIASQLMGCAAVSQSELLQMINKGDQIEIEVMAPISQEQGEESALVWEQLDQLTTYGSFRKAFETELGITVYGDNSKNGIVYINLEGNQEGNNTLYNAFMNRKFTANYWSNESIQSSVQDKVVALYVDVEEESSAANYAALNAYWNLLPDSTPNYFNGESTLTRGESMALVMRAETPVTKDLKTVESFKSAVGTSSELTEYASQVVKDSYLDISSKSLNNMTYNGTITRGEYIYFLVNHYFADSIKNVDIKSITFTDCKNGGDIAAAQKFIEDSNKKDYWKSYELTYALQNPDQGIPESLYKTMVAASSLGIIDANMDTRWDEGLTKTESLELLVSTYQAYTKLNGYPVDAVQGAGEAVQIIVEAPTEEDTIGGSMTGDDIELTDEETASIKEIEAVDSELEESNGIEIVEELNKDMYVIKNGNIRTGDGTNYDKVGSLEYGSKIHVTGKTSNEWYRIQWGESEAYASNILLSDTKPSSKPVSTDGNTGNTTGGNTAPAPTQPTTDSNNGGVPQSVIDALNANGRGGGSGLPASGTGADLSGDVW